MLLALLTNKLPCFELYDHKQSVPSQVEKEPAVGQDESTATPRLLKYTTYFAYKENLERLKTLQSRKLQSDHNSDVNMHFNTM